MVCLLFLSFLFFFLLSLLAFSLGSLLLSFLLKTDHKQPTLFSFLLPISFLLLNLSFSTTTAAHSFSSQAKVANLSPLFLLTKRPTPNSLFIGGIYRKGGMGRRHRLECRLAGKRKGLVCTGNKERKMRDERACKWG